MTGSEIKAAAEAYIGESMTDTDALEAINEALRTLADAAELYAETAITATQDNQWVSLPADATSPVAVYDADGKKVRNVFRQGTTLRLPKAGTYTLRYKRLPQKLAELTGTPDVPLVFHQAVVDYVISWWKLKDNEDSQEGRQKRQAFFERAREAAFALRRQRSPESITVIRDGRHEVGLGLW